RPDHGAGRPDDGAGRPDDGAGRREDAGRPVRPSPETVMFARRPAANRLASASDRPTADRVMGANRPTPRGNGNSVPWAGYPDGDRLLQRLPGEVTITSGRARVDRRTKRLVLRLQPGEVAVVDHR